MSTKQQYSEAFLKDWTNWQGLKTVALTIDIDFAPDFMIENLLEKFIKHKIKATIFVTHHSKYLIQQKDNSLFEFGIHPYLAENSTQGATLEEISQALCAPFGELVGNRFHQLKYGYRDLVTLGNLKFRFDVSTLHLNAPYLLPVFHHDLNMTLFTYSFEDGICENMNVPLTIDAVDLQTPGLKILNFHPLNTYLNAETAKNRLNFLSSGRDLLSSKPKDAERFCEQGQGAMTFLDDVISYCQKRDVSFVTLSEINNAFLRQRIV